MNKSSHNSLNLIGQKFGKLTVLEKSETVNRRSMWLCQCECGKMKILPGVELKRGRIKSCGCLIKEKNGGRQFKDITNQKFGKLTAIKPLYQDNKRLYVWLCKCDCGNFTEVRGDSLRSGSISSCGCMKSKGEERIHYLLKENKIPFECQKSFDDCRFPQTNRKARFDFYVNNSYIIEYDGNVHYLYSKTGWNNKENFEKTKEHDKVKNLYCKEKKIPLIRIPYTHLENIEIEDLILETSKFLIN